MVNLTQPRKGDIFLDPFCGTGSFLIEASFLGCQVLGFDIKRCMIQGSYKNLSIFGVEPFLLAVADARNLPIPEKSIDCIVTDPPYGRSTTTLGLDIKDVYKSFFSVVGNYIKNGRKICISAPKTVMVKDIGEQLGFIHEESHFFYVHKSLTREIALFNNE
jgi:tRNA (guanine10-N2)-dimethyltransferase